MKKKIFVPMLAFMLSFALVVAGCSFQSAIKELETYAPIGLNAFSQIVAILLEAGVIKAGVASSLSDDANKGTAVLGDLQATLAAYNSSASPDKLTAVINALSAVNSSLNQFEKDLGANTDSKASIAAQAGLVVLIGTLSSIQAKLAPASVPASIAKAVRASSVSAKTFKKQFNAAMLAHGYPQHTI